MKNNEDDRIQINDSSYKPQLSSQFTNNYIKYRLFIKIIFVFIFFIILYPVVFFINDNNNKIELKSLLSKNVKITNKFESDFIYKLKSFLDDDEIMENEMMNKHTTFQLGGPARFFIIPKTINKIIKIILLCKEYSIEYFILGNGSNLLVSDLGYNGLIIYINEINFSNLKVDMIDDSHNSVIVGGGLLMRTLAKKMCLLSLSGLEDIIDIPGTIGGGIIMNASAGGKGLIYNSLEKVKVITPDGEIKDLSKSECELRYRGSILKDKKYLVIEATFNLIKSDKIIIEKRMSLHTSKRYSRQPMYFPSAGSFFIWVKSKDGSLYEKYKENNLVSYKVGDAMIYTNNIAFIVNLGNAKSSDVYQIVTHVEKVIKEKYDIKIKREVIFLGSFK